MRSHSRNVFGAASGTRDNTVPPVVDRITLWMLFLALVPYLCIYLVLGWYAQPSADDFCFAGKLSGKGFLGSQLWWYLHWSGRYASTAIITSFIQAIDFIDRFWLVPALLITTACGSFIVLVLTLGRGGLTRAQGMCGGLLLTSLYLSGLPNTAEVVFWLAGGATYQLGNTLYLSLLALLSLCIAKETATRMTWLLAGLVVVISAGTNETMMLLQSATLLLCVAAAYALKSPQSRRLSALLALSLACAGLVMAAPGNAVRTGHFPLSHNLVFSVERSVNWAGLNVLSWSRSSTLWLSTVLWFSAVASLARRRQGFRPGVMTIAAAAASWLGLVTLTYFPAFWSMGGGPPPRTQSVSYLTFLLGWFGIVSLFAYASRREGGFTPSFVRFIVAVLALSLFTTGNGRGARRDLELAPQYSAQLEKRRDMLAQVRGAGEVRVPMLVDVPWTIHVTDITTDKENWINEAYATFFHLKSIVTVPRRL